MPVFMLAVPPQLCACAVVPLYDLQNDFSWVADVAYGSGQGGWVSESRFTFSFRFVSTGSWSLSISAFH